MAEIEQLREERDRLSLQAECSELRTLIYESEKYESAGRNLMEGWGDVVDPREHLWDDPITSFYSKNRIAILDDRTDGRFRPVYENETELAWIRGHARVLANGFPSGLNILENLGNYTFGKGATYAAEGEPEDDKLIQAVQRVIDDFLDRNDWVGDFEKNEVHDRTREDGECFIHLEVDGWHTNARCVEPEQVTEPANKRQLEDWLGTSEEYVSSWSFGIHTREHRPDQPIGYHVVYDGAGRDWDYVPVARMEHIKRNVKRVAKRGVSDYYPARIFLERAEKLLGNAAEGAAVQAAIAYIVEHGANAKQAGVSSTVAAARDRIAQRPTPEGTKNRSVRKAEPGHVPHIPAGRKYHAGPMGNSNAPNFVTIIQAALRYVGIRWSMPEYMVSGDASGSNYASTIVAESPFVKGREADQVFYRSKMIRLMWKIIRIAYERGFFDRFRLRWEDIEAKVNVDVQFPEVATRDRMKDAQANEILKRNGVISAKTWAEKEGLDHEQEVKDGAKPDAQPTSGIVQTPRDEALAAAIETAESLAEARDIAESFYP